MITVVYASRARETMSVERLTGLLGSARERNESLDVTGMLLYAHRGFLQQLEGDEAAVDAVYASIAVDPCHTDIRLLSRRDIADRRWPGWAMGFAQPTDASLTEQLPGYQPHRGTPLVSTEGVGDTQTAEALLGVYAIGQP